MEFRDYSAAEASFVATSSGYTHLLELQHNDIREVSMKSLRSYQAVAILLVVMPRSTQQPLENLRPQHIYDALLLRQIDPEKDIAVMENGYETVTDAKRHRVEQPDYEIDVIQKADHGWFLSRKIVFSRTDLLPHRQLIYDENGNLATDVSYE